MIALRMYFGRPIIVESGCETISAPREPTTTIMRPGMLNNIGRAAAFDDVAADDADDRQDEADDRRKVH